MSVKERVTLSLLLLILCLAGCSDKEKSRKYFYQAEKAFSEKNFSLALELADASIHEDSSFFNARILQGKVYYFTNQTEKAYEVFKKVYRKNPCSQDALLYLIRSCLDLKKTDEAEKLLHQGLTNNSSDWQLYYLYSVLEGLRGSQDKRLLYCRKAENILYMTENLYMELAEIYLTLGLKTKAYSSLEQAKLVSANPESVEALIQKLSQGQLK